MSAVTFIHAADLHLGRAFSPRGDSGRRFQDLFLTATYEAWESIVDEALERKVDFVTLGGDIFHSRSPSVRAQITFKSGIERLREADIPVFAVLGNHDPLCSFPQPLLKQPGLHVFGSDPEAVPVNDSAGVFVHGISFKEPSVRDNLVRSLHRHPDADIAVGLIHTNVSGVPGHDDYAPCTKEDLVAGGMDIWCLGHVHSKRTVLREPLALYPGTSQGARIQESGPCGCSLITVNGNQEPHARFIPIAPVQWEEVDVDVEGVTGPADLVDAALDACIPDREAADTRQVTITRINFMGRAQRYGGRLKDELHEIEDIISERLEEMGISACLESVRDSTGPHANLDELVKDEGFLAELVKLGKAAADDEALMRDLLEPCLVELSRQPFRKFIDPELGKQKLLQNSPELERMLEEAVLMVSDMFVQRSQG